MKMDKIQISRIIETLKKENKKFRLPSVSEISRGLKGPFFVLISCILSLRTLDKTTRQASYRLFNLARSPDEMLRLEIGEIQKVIYPVGFYRNKAKTIKGICKTLVNNFSSRVPDTLEGLLSLKGVGRKTANLVLTEGFGKLVHCDTNY